MEPENHKIDMAGRPESYRLDKEFISERESSLILDWIDGLSPEPVKPNHHLEALSSVVKGKAFMFDISNTEKTEYITNFQKVSRIDKSGVPAFISDIIDRISERLSISKDHVFLQAVDMRSGGKIDPHYDAAIDGYINYKCNISVLSEDYRFYIDGGHIEIQERDLYCFEASLFKHWTDEFKSRRVFLSIGFIVPYSSLGRDEEDPRIRLSKRIEKYFQRFNI